MDIELRKTQVSHPVLLAQCCEVDLLRLDAVHPTISGNKYFKLKHYLAKARHENRNCLVSPGGAYSNHLHALAFAGKEAGFTTIGIVRGEEQHNPTLDDCRKWGMQLHFVTRSTYRTMIEEEYASLRTEYPAACIVPEGGKGEVGVRGCEEILEGMDTTAYDQICCSVGTGTTLCGLIRAAGDTHVKGFVALKGAAYLAEDIARYTNCDQWELVHDYHFGGFGKYDSNLLTFMREFYRDNGVMLDFVYTAKMMFGILDEIRNGKISEGTKILAVHTGGLQGNRSFADGLF